jgi:hypothetical protein
MRLLLARAAAAAIALGACFWSRPAPAQELRVGAGMTLPIGPSDFTDLYDFGFHGGVEFTGSVNKKKTTHLGLAAYHHRFPLDEEGALDAANAPPGALDISGGTLAVTEVFLLARFELGDADTRPYLLLGFGGAHQDITTLETRSSAGTRKSAFDSELSPMLTGGFGVSHRFGRLAAFGQLRLVSLFDEDSDTVMLPVTVGVAF